MAPDLKSFPSRPEEWGNFAVVLTDSELVIGGWQVMQRWEQPLMEAMAAEITATPGNVLEVGFGMGMAAEAIISRGPHSYTVIEAHPVIATRAREWARTQTTEVRVLEGLWQDVLPHLDRRFDGILFDTYPLAVEERHRNNFAFIPHAPQLLRPRGVFTCYSDETIHFRTEHLALLLTYFDEVKLVKVTGLEPPPDCEYWHESHMVIPVARVAR